MYSRSKHTKSDFSSNSDMRNQTVTDLISKREFLMNSKRYTYTVADTRTFRSRYAEYHSILTCTLPYFRYVMGGSQAEQAGLHLSMGSLLDAEQQRAAAIQGAMVRNVNKRPCFAFTSSFCTESTNSARNANDDRWMQ